MRGSVFIDFFNQLLTKMPGVFFTNECFRLSQQNDDRSTTTFDQLIDAITRSMLNPEGIAAFIKKANSDPTFVSSLNAMSECHCHPNTQRTPFDHAHPTHTNEHDLRWRTEERFTQSLQNFKESFPNRNPVLLNYFENRGLFQLLVLIARMSNEFNESTVEFNESTVILVDSRYDFKNDENERILKGFFYLLKTLNIDCTIITTAPGLENLFSSVEETAHNQKKIVLHIYSRLQDIPVTLRKKITHITALDLYPARPINELFRLIQRNLNEHDAFILTQQTINKENALASFVAPDPLQYPLLTTQDTLRNGWEILIKKIMHPSMRYLTVPIVLSNREFIDNLIAKIKTIQDLDRRTFYEDLAYRLLAVPCETKVFHYYPARRNFIDVTPQFATTAASAMSSNRSGLFPPPPLASLPPLSSPRSGLSETNPNTPRSNDALSHCPQPENPLTSPSDNVEVTDSSRGVRAA